MDLIKKLTGKNPSEYEVAAKSLVNNSDVELFKELVKQDDFLFDFIKNNVAKRIMQACNKDNYTNLLNFFEYYSPSYDLMIADVLHTFGGDDFFEEMVSRFRNGTDSEKAYSAKYLSLVEKTKLKDILNDIRFGANSEFEPLAMNCIEILSILNDEVSKNKAIEKLNSEDEFEQFDGIKFLINFQAKDALIKIVEVMKKSTLSENIAGEIPYLIPLVEFLEQNFETALLVMCYITAGIPEIILPSTVCDFELYSAYEYVMSRPLTSSSATLLRYAKLKFEEMTSNEEYLFDCDKNTKDEINAINSLLRELNDKKLKSLLYDELFEESDFVFFAIDFVDEIEELEALCDSKNQTLVLKVLSLLKEKNALNNTHKDIALKNVTDSNLRAIVEAL